MFFNVCIQVSLLFVWFCLWLFLLMRPIWAPHPVTLNVLAMILTFFITLMLVRMR